MLVLSRKKDQRIFIDAPRSGRIEIMLCSVDGGAEQACTSPFVLTGLSDGAHQFAVVGEDALGNRGEVQSQSFTVTSTPLTIASAAVQGITQNTATLVWSTNLPANSQVVYGQGTSLDSSSALQSASVTAWRATLTAPTKRAPKTRR